ncbi:MAG: Pr6Pr family membrane protein [Roseinatronobacter sp.]
MAQMDPKYRKIAGAIGLMALAALVAQTLVLMPGRSLGQVLWRLSGAFTILTNTLVAVTMLRVAIMGRRASFGWMSMLTMSIIMVGVVYHALLADLRILTGLAWWADQGLHTLVPVAMAWFWLMEVARVDPRTGRPWLWLLWPMGFLVYALVRGRMTGRYVYPFLNVERIGWDGVALYVLGIGAIFAALAFGMAALGRRMPRRG